MNWSYLFKHWFGTITIAPFVFELFSLINKSSNRVVGLIEVYPITFIFSLIFSTPTYLVCGLIYYFLAKKEISIKYSKMILLLFTTLGILFTFHIVFNAREIFISISYVVTSIILGLILKFKNDQNKTPN